ncbi:MULTISPECIES: BTAD domain-containing putative transcriptional regulator [unclassified Saccharothrix]|uniref:BTAD domain-containing putative transcriptional regulator n=1 Tax=unclassified Saccharothrix TaxID=2593673 RepID=UPI00307DDE86
MAPRRLRVNVLGPLEIVDPDDGRRELPARGQLALVIRYLVLSAGREVPIETLVELVASARRTATNPTQARSDVHGLKLRAARLLGPDRIRTRRADTTYYLFRPAAEDSVDLAEFDDLLAAARAALAEGDGPAALTAVERALALWRGNPADPFDTEVLSAGLGRDHFVGKLLTAQRLLCRVLMHIGTPAALERVVTTTRDLVRHPEHQFEESLHLLLAEALLGLGDESAAVEVFDNFVYTLGGKPSPRFHELIEQGGGSSAAVFPAHAPQTTPSLREWLADTDRAVRRRRTLGAHRLQVGDLVDNRLLLPFTATDERHGVITDLQHHIERSALDRAPHSAPSTRLLVTGSPGMGKSMLLASLYLSLRERVEGVAADRRTVPFVLDLRQFTEFNRDPAFGSASWLADRIDTLGIGDSQLLLMLDSLDEFLANRQHAEIVSMLERPLFLRANVVCCRELFYDRHLRSGPFALSREVVTLRGWPRERLADYARRFYRHLRPGDETALVTGVLDQLATKATLSEVCATPLRANMLLDLLDPGPGAVDQVMSTVIDLPSLYRAWVQRTLESESSRIGAVLTAAQKGDLLRSLAWTFYDESPFDQDEPPDFSVAELTRHVRGARAVLGDRSGDGDVATVVRDLVDHSLLVESALLPHHDSTTGLLNFSHKSFQEFLVADHIMRAVVSDAAKVRQLFERYHSPEVVEFLRDMLTSVPPHSRAARTMVDIFTSAFTRSAAEDPSNEIRYARSRLALSQLAYEMANIPNRRIVAFLLEHRDRETDPWLRRSITIGLSFAGQIGLLDSYVDTLRAERQAGGTAPENAVNVGAQLSYFGDQPLDLLLPAHDQGLPVCRRTLQRLIYQLHTATHQASWRLDLYSLVDIATSRTCSAQEAVAVLDQNRSTLNKLCAKLESDPRCAHWPEIAELRTALHRTRGNAGDHTRKDAHGIA